MIKGIKGIKVRKDESIKLAVAKKQVIKCGERENMNIYYD